LFDAVVLAGGKRRTADQAGRGYQQVFIDIHGQPMLGYILACPAGPLPIGKVIVMARKRSCPDCLSKV